MTEPQQTPRGRFAPSPSGRMHLGNAWTALLAWLDIRKQNGAMVLRMEDLDPDRSRPDYAAGLLADLRWLGLDWDEGPDVGGPAAPYCQSQRSHYYQAAFDKLQQVGLVYPCFCSRAELRLAASAPHAGDTEVPYSGRCAALTELAVTKLRAAGRRLKVHRFRVALLEVRGVVGLLVGQLGIDVVLAEAFRLSQILERTPNRAQISQGRKGVLLHAAQSLRPQVHHQRGLTLPLLRQ